MGEINARGNAKDIMTRERARGESFASLRTTQPLVIICILKAMEEAHEPIHTQRKSRTLRDSKTWERVRKESQDGRLFTLSDNAPGGIPVCRSKLSPSLVDWEGNLEHRTPDTDLAAV